MLCTCICKTLNFYCDVKEGEESGLNVIMKQNQFGDAPLASELSSNLHLGRFDLCYAGASLADL